VKLRSVRLSQYLPGGGLAGDLMVSQRFVLRRTRLGSWAFFLEVGFWDQPASLGVDEDRPEINYCVC
jgi:hypothetical protein